MKKSLVSGAVFAGALACGVTLTAHGAALAKWGSHHASLCTVSIGQYSQCPVLSQDTFAYSEVTAATVRGQDTNSASAVTAKACVQWSTGIGGHCGTGSTNGAASVTGPFAIPVDTSIFATYWNEYAYIEVRNSYANFTLWGYDYVD